MKVPQKVKNAPLWLRGLVLVAIAVPFSIIALKTIVGVLGILAVTAIVYIAYQFSPWFADKIANLALNARKAEWSENPIPTLQLQYQGMVERLEQKLSDLKAYIAQVNQYRTNRDEYARNFPYKKDKIASYDAQLQKYIQLQKLKERKWKMAETETSAFGQVVIEAEAEWKMAQSALNVSMADEFNNDPMEMLKARTALNSVSERVNTAFAELDIALLEAPTDDNGNVIDITQKLTVKEAVER